ncbi:MAG: hypothetical protein ACYTKD_27740 [Planctomycetota bacterium]
MQVSEDRKRTCNVPDGDLIDLAWGKLDPERETEVLRHTMHCAECTAELEALKDVRESVGSAADVVPSVGFHEKVMDRVREGAARATPPSGIHAAGSATRRYAKIVERERSARSWVRPRWRLLVLATSAAATLSAVMLTRMWVLDKGARPSAREDAETRERSRRAVFARHAERRDCERKVPAEIIDGRLDLANALGEGGPLDEILGEDEIVLAGVEDLDQHETCLMAFRAEDWASFARLHESAPEGPARERFEAIAGSRRTVAVVDGRIEVPEDLLAKHIGGTSVVILKLRDRAEIWSRKALKTYIGLPPFQIGIDGVTLAPPRSPGSV